MSTPNKQRKLVVTPLDASEELALSLEHKVAIFGRAFDQVSDHVIITNAEGVVLYANKAAEVSTGYSAEEMIGSTPSHRWGNTMDKRFYETMWHTIKVEGKPFVGDVRNVRKDGTLYWRIGKN